MFWVKVLSCCSCTEGGYSTRGKQNGILCSFVVNATFTMFIYNKLLNQSPKSDMHYILYIYIYIYVAVLV